MAFSEYYPIRSQADIDRFLDQTNALHDGYLIGVQYEHRGHTGGNPHFIDPELTELRLRFMVTSIHDAVVELVFEAVSEFQIKDCSCDITDCAVSIDRNGMITWSDDQSTDPEIFRDGSYVIAANMKWRFKLQDSVLCVQNL